MSLAITARTEVSAPATLEALATRLSAVLSSGKAPHTARVVGAEVVNDWGASVALITLEWELP